MGMKLAFLRGQGKWGKEGPLEGFALGPEYLPCPFQKGNGVDVF